MFHPFNMSQVLQTMAGSKTLQGLDLELPKAMMLTQVLIETTKFVMLADAGDLAAKAEMAWVYEQLRFPNIAGLDLATVSGSISSSFGTTVGPLLVSQGQPDRNVKIMNIAGSTIFSANPSAFRAIQNYHDMKVAALRASLLNPDDMWTVLPECFDQPPPEFDAAAMLPILEDSTSHNDDDVGDFTYFSMLPREIQAKIWVTAADGCEGRVIAANEAGRGIWLMTGDRIPDLMRVNKQVMKDIVFAGAYKPLFSVHGAQKAYYFNPRVDSLRISTDCHVFGRELPAVQFHSISTNPRDLAQVVNLIVDLPVMELNAAAVIENVECMPGLASLKIWGAIESTFSYDLDAEIRKVDNRIELLPELEDLSDDEFDLDTLRGFDQLMHLRNIVEECFEGTDSMPHRIGVNLQYRPSI